MANENIVVPALERALNIMEYLTKNDAPVSLKEISGNLKIPTASAFRLMKNLSARGYVREINNGQLQYSIGPQIMRLAYNCQRSMSITTIAKPWMENLSEKTGQTSQLAILRGQDVIYVEQSFPSVPVNIIATLHCPVQINVSAAGKVLLAYAPNNECERILSSMPLHKNTEKTITDQERFRKELALTQKRGYGIDDEEFADGIGCLAAPIFNFHGDCIASIGITGHIRDYKDNIRFQTLIQETKFAASEISTAFGGYQEKRE